LMNLKSKFSLIFKTGGSIDYVACSASHSMCHIVRMGKYILIFFEGFSTFAI
jgi:hypothetical protein